MESGTSDQTIVTNQEADENSMVLDHFIQTFPLRTSSIVSENIAHDLGTGIEFTIPVASEINEVEEDSSPRMEPSLQTSSSMLDLADFAQSSGGGSTSSSKIEINPFIKDLLGAGYAKDAFEEYFSKLRQRLSDGVQQKVVCAFLEHNNPMEAKEKVQELFYLFEAMEYMSLNWKSLLNIQTQKRVYNLKPNLIVDIHEDDIYNRLLIHALSYTTKLEEDSSIGLIHSNSKTIACMSKYFEAIDFMIFLLNKLQKKKEPSLPLQTVKTLVTKKVHKLEEETISTFICLVINEKDGEAEYLFERLLEHMNPSDIINCGRVYNYALRMAQKLGKVYKFLSSPSLSKRYKDIVKCNCQLNLLAMELYDNKVKVQRFLVALYLKDVATKQKIDWEFVEQHDYPYLIKCVWEYHKRVMIPNDVKKYKWTSMQRTYVFTSCTIIVGGKDIINHLFEAWPTLINASYKGVTALHIAAFKGNEEVMEWLLMQTELDINVRTRRLFTDHEVNKFLKLWKEALNVTTFIEGLMKCKDESLLFDTELKDHEELIKDLLQQGEIEVTPKGYLVASEFIKKNLSSGKKWNTNRWKLPTYQTALHIATTKGHAKVIKVLCDAQHVHQKRLRCHEEDEKDQTPLDILYRRQIEFAEDFDFLGIEKILLSKQDVQNGIDRLYRNRQVLVDAVNTILVGAALIAGVTFVGWLQPPLGYAQYYDSPVPYPAPPSTYDSYLAVQGNLGVKAFAVFNSLSFFFAIATVIVGADAAFPTQRYTYIGRVVETMHLLLRRAIKLLIISLVCVLGAFGSAAIVVLPPSLFFRKDLVLSIIIGGGVCGYALWQLLSRHSKRVQRLNASIRHIIKFTNVF